MNDGNLIMALWDIKEFCDQFPYGECRRCPLFSNVRCIVGCPYDWNMTEIEMHIKGESE